MIVDTHVHVWEMPPTAPIGSTAPTFTSLPEESAPIELLMEDLDANGVDGAILVQTSWSTWDNTYVAIATTKYPERLRSIGLIDPLDPASVSRAHHWIETFGMRGFRFHPDYYPDIEILTVPHTIPLLKAIEDREGIVKVHNSVANAHQLNEASSRYPGITWIIDHLMYPEPRMAPDDWREYQPVLHLAKRKNVFLTISDLHSRSNEEFPFRDMHEVLKRAIDTFGVDRCLWGTGFPGHLRLSYKWPSLADELRLIREGSDWLSPSERSLILGEIARRLFNYD